MTNDDSTPSAGPSALGSLQELARPGDGHLLGRSDDIMLEQLDEWLPEVLGLLN